MADMYAVSGEALTAIADAIRSKTGSDDFMTVASMVAAIEGISGGDIPTAAGLYVGVVEVYEDSQYLTIPHNLGRVCNTNIAVDITILDPLASYRTAYFAYALLKSDYTLGVSCVYSANANHTGHLGSTMENPDYIPEFETMYTKLAISRFYNPIFRAGHKYLCVCF